MKKTFLFLILGALMTLPLFISCSSSDDDENYTEIEPNDSPSNATSFTADGTVNTAAINPAGDYDGFYYDVSPNSYYLVTITWKSGDNFDIYLQAFDQDLASFGTLDEYYEGYNESGVLSTRADTSGIYLVVSDCYDSNEGSYEITVAPYSSSGRMLSDTRNSIPKINGNISRKDEKKINNWK